MDPSMPEPKGLKRPRDPNQLAKLVVDLATMDEDERRELQERLQEDQTPGSRGSATPSKGKS